MKTIKKIEERANCIFAQKEEKGFANLSQIELEETTTLLLKLLKELEIYISKTQLAPKTQIYCLKVVKPTIAGRKLFFRKLMVFERSYLASSNECHKVFYKSVLDEIREYIVVNRRLFTYYSLKHETMDNVYFTLDEQSNDLFDSQLAIDCYSVFHTSYSRVFANFVCCELLNSYVSWRLSELQNNSCSWEESHTSTLYWTGTRTSIVELGYALYASSTINSGTATIKEIMEILSEAFNIELGDYYRIYSDIKSRKKGRAIFLENLKNALLQKIEADEE